MYGIMRYMCCRGPICMIRVVGRGGECVVGGDHQVERSVALLDTLDWDLQPDSSLASLQAVVNNLLKLTLSPHTEGNYYVLFFFFK